MDNNQEPMRGAEWLARNPDRIREMPADVHEQHKALGRDAFQLEVVAAPRGDASTMFRAPDGTPISPGKTLREYREQFGGDEGAIEHPVTGEMVPVSLKRWKASDPDNTIILVSFVHHRSAKS
jgi:hypothetical protein